MKHLKLIILIFVGLSLLLNACNKSVKNQTPSRSSAHDDPKDTCIRYYYYLRPLGIVFKGFNQSALHKIIINRYFGETNFQNRISTDTLYFADSQMIQAHDTVLLLHDTSAARYFWTLEAGIDYKVSIPLAYKNYEITGTQKGPDSDTFETDGPCGLGNFEVLPFINTHIDGTLEYPVELEPDALDRYLFLVK